VSVVEECLRDCWNSALLLLLLLLLLVVVLLKKTSMNITKVVFL
jgi:hypothetical protein